jgi:hypothetical protein
VSWEYTLAHLKENWQFDALHHQSRRKTIKQSTVVIDHVRNARLIDIGASFWTKGDF